MLTAPYSTSYLEESSKGSRARYALRRFCFPLISGTELHFVGFLTTQWPDNTKITNWILYIGRSPNPDRNIPNMVLYGRWVVCQPKPCAFKA